MGMSIVIFIGFIPLLIIQSYIYKKILDPIYLNSNHFSLYEVSVFGSFPLSLVKTLAYIRAIIFPSTMLKRFNTKILNSKDKPFIYFFALLTMLILIVCFIILLNTFVMGILFYYFNN